MNNKNNSYSINNLIFITPFTPNKSSTLSPLTPSTTGKLSTNYTNNNKTHRNIYKNIYKTHSKTESYNKNNFQTNYVHSLPTYNKLRDKFLFKSLNQGKILGNKILVSSIKSPYKIPLKKENLFFIPKKYQIYNLHRILMEKNKASIMINQEKELQNMKTLESNLIQENNPLLEKGKYKPLINKAKTKKIKNAENATRNKDFKIFGLSKTVKEKEPILEINHYSNFPKIMTDKKLVFNLWKKDMMKYCDLTLEKNKKNKILRDKLLSVYN